MKKLSLFLALFVSAASLFAQNTDLDPLKNDKIAPEYAPLASQLSDSALHGKGLRKVKRQLMMAARAVDENLVNDYKSNRVRLNNETMRYTLENFGKKPKNGWPLVISLHGGGTCPAEVNDGQWSNQQSRYRASLNANKDKFPCRYIAPRAARDHEPWHPHCFPLLQRLIKQQILLGGVDPDKVYIMGYSEGGYACYRIIPSMVDRLAGIAPGGAADILDLAPAENLMNCVFNVQVGSGDGGFDRNKLAKKYIDRLDELQKKEGNDLYIHKGIIHNGFGHDVPDYRPENSAIHYMLNYKRNPFPKRIAWNQGRWKGASHMYWISIPDDDIKNDARVNASVNGNTITLTSPHCKTFTLYLSDELLDLSKPVVITINNIEVFNGKVPCKPENLIKSWQRREDPAYVVPALITVSIP